MRSLASICAVSAPGWTPPSWRSRRAFQTMTRHALPLRGAECRASLIDRSHHLHVYASSGLWRGRIGPAPNSNSSDLRFFARPGAVSSSRPRRWLSRGSAAHQAASPSGSRLAGSGRCKQARIVRLAAHHDLPGDACGLVRERDGGELGRLALQERRQPGRSAGAAAPDLLDERRRAAATSTLRSVSSPARVMPPCLCLAPGRVILGASGRSRRSTSRPERNASRIGDLDRRAALRADRPNRRHLGQAAGSARCRDAKLSQPGLDLPAIRGVSCAMFLCQRREHLLGRARKGPRPASMRAQQRLDLRRALWRQSGPNSAAWPRIVLLSCVRRRISISRAPRPASGRA